MKRFLRLCHKPGFNTVGADHYFFNLTVMNRSNPLKIRIKSPFIQIMRMTHMIADHRFFPANFTLLGHDILLETLLYK